MTRTTNFIIAFCILFSTNAYARWATFADAPVEVLSSNTDIMVHKDGTSETVYEGRIKILNEAGRNSYAAVPLYYVKDNSELTIEIARIINGDVVLDLDKDNIEDKPLASDIKGFDEKHQVLLAFPNIQIGSIIHLKWIKKVIKPDLPGFFEEYLSFGGQYWQQATVNIKSELPLYYDANQLGYLNIKPGKENKLHVLNITLDKPIFINIVDEYQMNISPQKFPWVFVTTSNNWQVFGKKVATPYLKVMQQPLPSIYQEILEAAKQHKDPIEQINTVTSLLNEKIQYMGDWKSAQGRFVPQDLARVAQRRMGDCKDMATATAVILRELGMQAHVALVNRYSGIYYSSTKLPGMGLYNHAITRVQVAKNVYWVDPTNFFSIADVVLPDIAGRPALVLMDESRVDNIPQSNPADNSKESVKNINLQDPFFAEVDGKFNVHGLAAIDYTGAEMYTSKNTIVNNVLSQLGNFEYMHGQTVNLPPLMSRIVSDLEFDYKFAERDYVSLSNAGFVTQFMDGGYVAAQFIFNPVQVSDVYLGPPITVRKIYNYFNVNPAGTLALDSKLSSPWLDISREVHYKDNAVQIVFSYTIKQAWIPNETLHTAEYKKMEQQLSKFFSNPIMLVFK